MEKYNLIAIDPAERLPEFEFDDSDKYYSSSLLFRLEPDLVNFGHAIKFKNQDYIIFQTSEDRDDQIYDLSQIICWYELPD